MGATRHTLQKKDDYGELELQEMCFYLENKFQETLGNSEAVPVSTDPKVYIRKRDQLTVYAKQFGGWAFTAATWMKERDDFEENDLTDSKWTESTTQGPRVTPGSLRAREST